MRLRRQLQLGVGVVALGFAVSAGWIVLELARLGPMTDRLVRDETIAQDAVRLERGARMVEAGACMHGRDHAPLARQLMTEGRAEVVDAADRLGASIDDDSMAADLDDIRAVAGAVLAGAEAAARRAARGDGNGPGDGAGAPSGALESRAEALRVKLESLVARAQRTLVGTRRDLIDSGARARDIILASLVIIALLGLAAAAFVAHRVVGRLRVLMAGVRRIGDSDLSWRVPDLGDDELGDLGRAFNQMTRDLEQAQARLVEAERMAAVGHVAVAIRHEVSNPVQGLLGAVDLIRESPKLDGDTRELVEAMRAEILRIGETMGRLDHIESTATCPYVGDLRMLDLGTKERSDGGTDPAGDDG